MEALMEEDMERLRARRRAAHGTRGRNAVPHSPADSTFSSDSAGSSVILGLGTGVGIRDILPLKSRFFDWCCEYFKEPQMRVSGRLNYARPGLRIFIYLLASRS
jgi:regulator-associated protein of mTOR